MVIKTTAFSQASQLENKKRFLNCLENNPYVVSYYGKKITLDKKSKKMLYNMILEYCRGQCFAEKIKRHKGIGLPEEDVKRFALDILIAKISGFGKTMEKGSSEYGDGWGYRRGTTQFISPELTRDKILDYGADVWAFGCTVFEMLTGELVWSEHGELVWEDWITLIGVSDMVPYVHNSHLCKQILCDFSSLLMGYSSI
ncbi:BnaA04g11130D [Brassica napus]|nr:unnamed protein product [Brassica napus]CDY39740.1 BnaA04g11130D [Brassica napus]